MSAWQSGAAADHSAVPDYDSEPKRSHRDALQALLAFSALHQQVKRRRALAARFSGFDAISPDVAFESGELFVLDEVLQLVAERAVAITGADGLAIALAEDNEIVLRASAGAIKPDVGARIDRDSAFSGACFRMAQIVRCDDTEADDRVNVQACRRLGARSMVAVPLCGRRRVIGLVEAFSAEPFGFNDSDMRSLELLAELILGALKPEDEDRFAQSAQAAETALASAPVVNREVPLDSPLPEKGPIRIEPRLPEPKKIASAEVLSSAVISAPAITTPPVATPPIPAPPTAALQIPANPVIPAIAPAVMISPAKIFPTTVSPAGSTPGISTPAVGTPGISAPAVGTPAVVAPANLSAMMSPAATPRETAEKDNRFELNFLPEGSSTSDQTLETESAPTESGEEESQPANQRHTWLIAIACVVFAALFAAGLWWKLKTEQLGSVVVQPQKPILKPVHDGVTGAPLSTTTSPTTQAPTADIAAPGAVPAPDDSANRPATAQELSKFPRVTGIRHWSSAESTSVVLDLEDQVQYEPGHLSNPDRVYFDLRDTQLVPELQGKSMEVEDALLARIRVAQPVPGMTRVVLEAKPGAFFSPPHVSLEHDPYRLVIRVSKLGTNPRSSVDLFPETTSPQKKVAIVVPPPTKEDLQLRARVPKLRIVVDPGHGGWDLGTVGRRGLLEKDLVLEVAQRLGKLLETRLGADVIYTRQDDNYIPLDERAQIANHQQADLFVSVHANYSDLASARGVETYYTSFFSSPDAKDASAKTSPAPSSPSLTPAELHEKVEESRRLAASVQRSLYGSLSVRDPGLRDRGVKEDGFVVLTETTMPGILAEVSFVSSPTDEQKLRSDGYREEIAEALYKGIARYAASSRGVKVASAGK